MNYLASGIQHTFTFELLDPFLYETRGWLTVFSASIQEGYDTDSKASATIECDASTWRDNSAVRIYDTLTLNGESETVCIGTFILDSTSELKTDKKRHITLSMLHPIDKLTTDLRPGDCGVASGGSVASWCKSAIEDSGCSVDIREGVVGTFSSSWVWEHGESVLEAVNRACGSRYQVSADVYGRVVISPYVEPYKREAVQSITSAQIVSDAVIDSGDICNRVVVEAEQNGEQLAAFAVVDASHPWAFGRLGRWYTKSYTETELDEFTQQAVQNLANHYMAENDGTTRKWEIEAIYFPCFCGQNLNVSLGGDSFICMITQRRYTLGKGTMKLILEEVG